ncbi:MAG TPA: Ppx/GppA phosphatase family protein, partial [Mycobacteriales bacterium]|nr:Ppx/GppA phosphatase family protein [Mycobacteriales bacterium]
MTRVAAVDCGTNSIRLLVADVEGGRLVERTRQMQIVRLGEGVDRTGSLAAEALERTFVALRDYARIIGEMGVDRVRMCATSATRDAANRDAFVDGCTAILGVAPEVISGAEEAAASFRGATAELPRVAHPAPYLVVDIGGGSTELVLGGASVEQSVSLDIGCVRLTERHLRTDPPTPAEVAAAEGDVDELLLSAEATVDVRHARTMVGLAGSVTTVAALSLGLTAYDPTRIHLSRTSYDDVDRITTVLLTSTRAERLDLPVMHPGRADVIGGGALVLRAIMRRWSIDEVVASERDILDGIALGLA